MAGDRVTRTVRMDRGLAERIDEARGGVPFEAWAREAFAQRLGDVARVHPPMLLRGTSSAEAKADVKPIPKGKTK